MARPLTLGLAHDVFSEVVDPRPVTSDSGLLQLGLNRYAAEPDPSELLRKGPLADFGGYKPDLVYQVLITLGREYTPNDINTFRRNGRSGDPRMLFSFYDEFERLLIGPMMEKLFEGVVQLTHTFTATPEEYQDGSVGGPEAKAARLNRDYVIEQWGPHMAALKKAYARAKGVGIAAELVDRVVRGARGKRDRIRGLETVPARRFRMDPSTQRWIFMPNVWSFEGIYVDELVAAGDMIWFEPTPWKHIDQRGYFFQCLLYWGLAQFALRWWGKGAELSALIRRYGFFDANVPNQQALMEAILEKQAAAAWAALPKGTEIKSDDSGMASSRANPLRDLFLEMDRACQRTILGHEQAMSVQVGAGSLASSEVAERGLALRVNGIGADMAPAIVNGPCENLVTRNLGPEAWAETPVALVCAMPSPDDPVKLSTTVKTLVDAGGSSAIPLEDIVRRCTGRAARKGELTFADAKRALADLGTEDAVGAGDAEEAGAVGGPRADTGPRGHAARDRRRYVALVLPLAIGLAVAACAWVTP